MKGGGGLEPVQFRHMAGHEHHVVIQGGCHLEAFATVGGDVDEAVEFGQHFAGEALCSVPPMTVAAEIYSVDEYAVKAAYIYKICSYVSWPNSANKSKAETFVIGVMDDERMVAVLKDTLKGRTILQRPIEVRTQMLEDSVDDVQVLYIGNVPNNTPEILDIRHFPVLTVASYEGHYPQAIVNFVVEDQRVRFDISESKMNQSRLKLGAELFAVARNVYRERSQ